MGAGEVRVRGKQQKAPALLELPITGWHVLTDTGTVLEVWQLTAADQLRSWGRASCGMGWEWRGLIV
jgi:hypothetical protein